MTLFSCIIYTVSSEKLNDELGVIQTNKLINYIEKNPSLESNSHAGTQEINRLLYKPKVHNRVLNSPPLLPTLSQMHTIHEVPPYFPKFYSNIISI
jgi:hypothetical protein